MADKEYYFRCKSNPQAPILVLANYWEAAEMKGHPDYDRVDERGLPIIDEEAEAPERIPLQSQRRK